MIKRIALRSSIFTSIVSAMMIASPVLAQDAATPEEPEADAEVVIVRATGRTAALQDIPVAVTAVSAQTIQNAGVTDVRNLQQVTPSYRVATGQSNSAGTSINIRGLGTGADNPGFEAAVGVFIDGVYRNRSGVALSELPQLERVEILRGPQGTLFGRNTSAGAVTVYTAGPKFEANTYGRIEYGDYNALGAVVGTTGPLSENTAFRVEGGYSSRDGYLEDVNSGNTINDKNRYFVRGQTLTDITDNLTLRLIVDGSSTDEVCCYGVHIETAPVAGAVNTLAGLRGITGIPTVNAEARRVAISPGRAPLEQVDEWGASSELNWDVADMKFTWIASYRDWTTVRNQDIDFSGMDRAYREGFELGFKTTTQEFRLNGQAGIVDWLVGAFYANEQIEYEDTVRFGIDAARYADALAGTINVPMAAVGGTVNPCTGNSTYIRPGSTMYGSLGPGAGNLFQQIVCPGIFQSAFTAAMAATGNNVALSQSIAQGQAVAISTLYGNQIAATAPTPGQGQTNELAGTDTTSFAFFTHNQIALTEQLNLTLGLRYSTETKDLSANLNAVAPGCGVLQNTNPIAGPGTPSANQLSAGFVNSALGQFQLFACNPVVNTRANGVFADSTEESAWSGTASLRYNFSDDAMVYATYARGYKGGGYNLDRSAFTMQPTTTTALNIRDWRFDPEFVDNYEIGWKLSGLPMRTTLNGAIFRQNITDYQINAFSGFNFFAFNVPKLVSQGVEIDLVSRPLPGLTLNGGMLWNDAYVDGATSVRGVFTIPDGEVLSGAAEWTFTGGITYRGQISPTLGYLLYLDTRYLSEYQTQTIGRAASGITDQEAFALTNARVGIGANDGTWGLEFWVRNITDEFYFTGAFGVPEQTGNFAVYSGEPRTMGATLRVNF